MAGDFDGKIVLVTGSSTGLGAAIAVGAAKRGAKAVIVNYASSAKEAEATADEIRKAGADVVVVQGDVGEDADCRKIVEAAAKFGKIDALANNAASPRSRRTTATSTHFPRKIFCASIPSTPSVRSKWSAPRARCSMRPARRAY